MHAISSRGVYEADCHHQRGSEVVVDNHLPESQLSKNHHRILPISATRSSYHQNLPSPTTASHHCIIPLTTRKSPYHQTVFPPSAKSTPAVRVPASPNLPIGVSKDIPKRHVHRPPHSEIEDTKHFQAQRDSRELHESRWQRTRQPPVRVEYEGF